MAYGSPFTPKPGQLPSCPRGHVREVGIVRDFARQVAHAQVSDTNGLYLTGSQGIGKTALLSSVAVQLQERGWRVAMVDRSDPRDPGRALGQSLDSSGMRGIGSRVRDKLQQLRGSVKGGSISIGLDGPSASLDLGRPQSTQNIATQITDAGRRARQSGRPSIVLIDDLHQWSPNELKQLCEGLDTCAREGHPIGVVATGRPAGVAALTAADPTRVFDSAAIKGLTPDEASTVLTDTAAVRGVTIEPEAHDQLVTFSQGHPDRLQLAAHEAWKAMPIGDQVITAQAASQGIEQAAGKLDRQIHAPNWQALSPAEQSMAQAMASVGRGPVEPAAVQTRMSPQHRGDFEAVRAGLVAKDVVHESAGGKLAFNNPGTEPWILANRPPSGSVAHILQGNAPARQVGASAQQVGVSAQQLGASAQGQGQRPAHLDRGKTVTGPTYER